MLTFCPLVFLVLPLILRAYCQTHTHTHSLQTRTHTQTLPYIDKLSLCTTLATGKRSLHGLLSHTHTHTHTSLRHMSTTTHYRIIIHTHTHIAQSGCRYGPRHTPQSLQGPLILSFSSLILFFVYTHTHIVIDLCYPYSILWATCTVLTCGRSSVTVLLSLFILSHSLSRTLTDTQHRSTVLSPLLYNSRRSDMGPQSSGEIRAHPMGLVHECVCAVQLNCLLDRVCLCVPSDVLVRIRYSRI
jgi:hypothetical protein